MNDADIGGPEWYYTIPQARRERYEHERERARATWWANRIRKPVEAGKCRDQWHKLAEELCAEYPPPRYRMQP